jgi:hypothetical protein
MIRVEPHCGSLLTASPSRRIGMSLSGARQVPSERHISAREAMRPQCGVKTNLSHDAFVEKPGALLGFVDPVLNKTGGGDVAMLIADFVSRAQVPGERLIV